MQNYSFLHTKKAQEWPLTRLSVRTDLSNDLEDALQQPNINLANPQVWKHRSCVSTRFSRFIFLGLMNVLLIKHSVFSFQHKCVMFWRIAVLWNKPKYTQFSPFFSLLTIHIFISSPGDEILSVNGRCTAGLTHGEAIRLFKDVRAGPVLLRVTRRPPRWLRCACCDLVHDQQAPAYTPDIYSTL